MTEVPRNESNRRLNNPPPSKGCAVHLHQGDAHNHHQAVTAGHPPERSLYRNGPSTWDTTEGTN